MRGAGGTNGGVGTFFLGLALAGAGLYLLLHNITVSSGFNLGYPLYRFSVWHSQWSLTSGSMLIPLVLGIGLIFYNARSPLGWVLAPGALLGILFGVLMSLNISLRTMSLLDLLLILGLCGSGLGLFLRSLRAR